MAVCSACLGLDVEEYLFRTKGLKNIVRRAHLTTVGDLRASTSRACPGCTILCRGLEDTDLQAADRVHVVFEKGLPLRLEATNVNLEFFVPPGTDCPGPFIGQGRVLLPNVDAASAASFALEQLQKCKLHHKYCSRFTRSANHHDLLPKRLIFVGNDKSSLDMRLVETTTAEFDSSDELPPYVALSYCRGSLDANLTTTVSNIDSRLSSIHYQDLPRTLQDAVDVTRAVGVEYIWVDSLCIIQNDIDDTDWRVESAKMGFIYRDAILTLAATRSASVTDGFLGPRIVKPNDTDEAREVKWTNFDGREVTVHIRHRLSHSAVVSEDSDASDCPLLKRGWTLQERVMSTRILHFLPREILWECKSDFACECLGVEADQRWKTGHVRGSLFNQAMSSPRGVDWTIIWQNLITEFSRRLFTNRGDRLPALSGIASQLQALETNLQDYHAGLWQRDMLWQLTWQADYDYDLDEQQVELPKANPFSLASSSRSSLVGSFSDTLETRRKRLEPSWSWVSTACPVKWTTISLEARTSAREDARIIRVSCDVDEINPLGQVISGEIRLEADTVSTIITEASTNIWRLGNGAIMIPDDTNLGLSPGDTIHCALLHTRMKDNTMLWTALALRRIAPLEAENDASPTGTHKGLGPTWSQRFKSASLKSPDPRDYRDPEAYDQALAGYMNAAFREKIRDNGRPITAQGSARSLRSLEQFYRVGLVMGSMHHSYFGASLFGNRREVLIV